MSTSETPTPRTDAELFAWYRNPGRNDCGLRKDDSGTWVPADFARQLERELNWQIESATQYAQQRDAVYQRCAELERERAIDHANEMSALALVAKIREALGDNGKRMPDELIDHCKALVADSERLDAYVRMTEAEDPDVPAFDGGRWYIPYLVSNDGGASGGVGQRNFPSFRAAIDAARKEAGK